MSRVRLNTPTTKDVALLYQLYETGQLNLKPDFQRNSVWPVAAKAYLIDTILETRPIPQLMIQRETDANTGKPLYWVIDGQQRLRAVFAFMENDLRTPKNSNPRFNNRFFKDLMRGDREMFLNYDFLILELSGYDETALKDCFVRMNKYVVKLSRQEIRHAEAKGPFKDFVERISKWPIWNSLRIFTRAQRARMIDREIIAELIILLLDGPQNKKGSLDLYYRAAPGQFRENKTVAGKLEALLEYLHSALPSLHLTRFKKRSQFYTLIGALERIAKGDIEENLPTAEGAGLRLTKLCDDLASDYPPVWAIAYLESTAGQTDNIIPRMTRIDIIAEAILGDL